MYQCIRGLVSLVAIGGAVMIFPKIASANNCTVFSSSGTPLAYIPRSTSGGGGNIQNFGMMENRITMLEKTYTITFECVGNQWVDLFISLNSIEAPVNPSSGAENLDLINTDKIGVTNQVTVVDQTNNRTLISDITANSDGIFLVNPITEGNHRSLDSNQRITFNLKSTFLLTGGAEEFAEGDYKTEFLVGVTPNINNSTTNNINNINGTVEPKCSVQSPSQYTERGGVTPIPYQINTQIIEGEQRVNELFATDRVLFDCNTMGFQYSINLDNFTVPSDFINAKNLDLVTNSISSGVDHQVEVKLKFPSGNVSDLTRTYSLRSAGTVAQGISSQIDSNGDVEIELTSRFFTVNRGEELGAGTYQTGFSITVTAQ